MMRLIVKYTDRHGVPPRVIRTDELCFDELIEYVTYPDKLKLRYSCVVRNPMRRGELFVCLNEGEMEAFAKEE